MVLDASFTMLRLMKYYSNFTEQAYYSLSLVSTYNGNNMKRLAVSFE